MKSVTTIGKTREHLKLWVEDESGSVRDILWWGGAGEEMPETGGMFDIAYSLRASTFRGERQLSLQFEEFRVREDQAIALQPANAEVMDYRSKTPELLTQITSNSVVVQVWAEGADKARGKSLSELTEAEELVIYTTPPSPHE